MNTMKMTAAIQYILTVAKSLDSQDYYQKSPMTILGLAGVLFCENEQAQTKRITIVCTENNTWVVREARRGLKAIVGNQAITLST